MTDLELRAHDRSFRATGAVSDEERVLVDRLRAGAIDVRSPCFPSSFDAW